MPSQSPNKIIDPPLTINKYKEKVFPINYVVKWSLHEEINPRAHDQENEVDPCARSIQHDTILHLRNNPWNLLMMMQVRYPSTQCFFLKLLLSFFCHHPAPIDSFLRAWIFLLLLLPWSNGLFCLHHFGNFFELGLFIFYFFDDDDLFHSFRSCIHSPLRTDLHLNLL